jgi:hypothetical protein
MVGRIARIRTTPAWRAVGPLRVTYQDLCRHTPRIGYVVQIFSLRPSLVGLVGAFFIDVLGSGVLTRVDKELLCVVTSAAGRCRY